MTTEGFWTKVANRRTLPHLLIFVALVLTAALAVALIVNIPVQAENDRRVDACAEIGGKPVRIRTWVEFCEMPNGVIERVPGL